MTKAKLFFKTLAQILFAAVFIALTVFDVVSLAWLAVQHLGLPFDMAILLSGFGMVVFMTVLRVITDAICKVVARRQARRTEPSMNHAELAALISEMNSLQAGSFEARQALIRESFQVQQGQYSDYSPSNVGSQDSEPIEAEVVSSEQD